MVAFIRHTEIRSCYWIRSFVRKVLFPCMACKKLNARALSYPSHSDQPPARFDCTHVFSSTGVDYMGPLLCLPIYGPKDKSYVVLYTCAATRAIILDVVHNVAADTFKNSFRRFIARRGCPSNVISENGSSFAAEETIVHVE